MWSQMKILKIHVEEKKKSISDMADTMASATFQSHSVLNQIHVPIYRHLQVMGPRVDSPRSSFDKHPSRSSGRATRTDL